MGEKIHLLRATLSDAAKVYHAWGYNALNFTYLTASPHQDIQGSARYLEKMLLGPHDLVFHIEESASAAIVGLIKAKVEGHKALVGYVVDRPHWGKGLATAAVKAMVSLLSADETISRIWATCATNNPASVAVLEKCGFVPEGILKNWVVYPAQGGKAHDNYSYSIQLPLFHAK